MQTLVADYSAISRKFPVADRPDLGGNLALGDRSSLKTYYYSMESGHYRQVQLYLSQETTPLERLLLG